MNKVIIPVKFDLDPYGFIGRFQALKWNVDKLDDSIRGLIQVIVDRKVLDADSIIEGFSKSYSYRNAEFNTELLNKIENFTETQANKIALSAVYNSQIWNAGGTKTFLRNLFSKYSTSINPDTVKQWNRLLKGE